MALQGHLDQLELMDFPAAWDIRNLENAATMGYLDSLVNLAPQDSPVPKVPLGTRG